MKILNDSLYQGETLWVFVSSLLHKLVLVGVSRKKIDSFSPSPLQRSLHLSFFLLLFYIAFQYFKDQSGLR